LNPRGLALALACLCAAAALLFARPVATPGPALRDFEAYWSAGAAWNAREDPYGRAVWNAERGVKGVDASRDELLPFVGPPATLLLWSAFARLPYATAAAVWRGVLAAALLALLIVLARAAEAAPSPFAALALAALALGFGPVTSDVALGQIALLALLGAAACVTGAAQPVAASLGAFVASLQPNVALGLVSQLGRNRATFALAAGAVLAYLAGVAAAGWAWPVAYLHVLAEHAAAERFTAIQVSPAAIAYGFGAPATVATAIGYAVAALAVAAAIATILRLHERFARFAAVSALVPLVAGFFHEHDLVVAFPAAVLCAFRARGAARSLALCGTLFVAVDWLGLAQRPTGIVQSALLALAAAGAFISLGAGAELRQSILAAIALAPIFAAAAWLAAGHPAPVWPDALGAFHATPAQSAASVWNAEQRQSGLLAQQPTWSLLRSFSLIGCALLAAATSSLYARRSDIDVHHVVEGRDGVRVPVL